MLQIAPRSERNLRPYVSPKKEWDLDDVRELPEVAAPEGDGLRAFRRRRQRDLASMGRKSRRKAFRQRFTQHQAEQDFRGMARVRLLWRGTGAMYENVSMAIWAMAEREVGPEAAGQELQAAVDRIDGMLRDVAVAYGDIDD